jgi:hypothetical protein
MPSQNSLIQDYHDFNEVEMRKKQKRNLKFERKLKSNNLVLANLLILKRQMIEIHLHSSTGVK